MLVGALIWFVVGAIVFALLKKVIFRLRSPWDTIGFILAILLPMGAIVMMAFYQYHGPTAEAYAGLLAIPAWILCYAVGILLGLVMWSVGAAIEHETKCKSQH